MFYPKKRNGLHLLEKMKIFQIMSLYIRFFGKNDKRANWIFSLQNIDHHLRQFNC